MSKARDPVTDPLSAKAQRTFDSTKQHHEIAAINGHPTCHFCDTRAACFCVDCIVPTWEELHFVVCHTCHAEHLGITKDRICPTCLRMWPRAPKGRGAE